MAQMMSLWRKSKKYDKEFLSKKYDLICNKADRLFRNYNPCKFNKNSCIGRKSKENITSQLCCVACKYYDKEKKCTVKAIACKLWTCHTIKQDGNNDILLSKLNKLRLVAEKYRFLNDDFYFSFRASKEDIFNRLGF